MCNLYSITTNQEAIIRLFRVMNRYVGNLPPMPGVFPRLSGARGAQRWRRARADHDALGHAATAKVAVAPGDEHPEYVVAALARLVEAGEPLLGAGQ